MFFFRTRKKSPENQIFPSRDNKETYLKFNDDLYQYPSNLGPLGQFLFLIPKKGRAKFNLKLAQLYLKMQHGIYRHYPSSKKVGPFNWLNLNFFSLTDALVHFLLNRVINIEYLTIDFCRYFYFEREFPSIPMTCPNYRFD